MVKIYTYKLLTTKQQNNSRCSYLVENLKNGTKLFMKNFELLTETYSKPCQVSKMECFAKIVDDFKSLTVFAKYFILDF